jgi:hypothetical protein
MYELLHLTYLGLFNVTEPTQVSRADPHIFIRGISGAVTGWPIGIAQGGGDPT